MISLRTLRFLTRRRHKDALVLFSARQYASAVYMMGYAVEMALKNRICLALSFTQGFPETKQELSGYITQLRANVSNDASSSMAVTNIKQIRHHKLRILLENSGRASQIKAGNLSDWMIVADWDPQQRYQKLLTRKSTAERFIRAADLIIKRLS